MQAVLEEHNLLDLVADILVVEDRPAEVRSQYIAVVAERTDSRLESTPPDHQDYQACTSLPG